MIRGGAIFGRVLDPFGEPSIGTRVQVLRVRVEGNTRRLVSVGPAIRPTTRARFVCMVCRPASTTYRPAPGLIDAVKRDAPVYHPGTLNFTEAQPIALEAGAEASADFQIVEAVQTVRVSGVVLSSSGAPAPGAMVNLSSNTMSTPPPALKAW